MLARSKLQSRGFSKPPERVRLRDQDREPQKLARDDVSFVGGVSRAIPKTEPKRNRALLDMAKGRGCLLCIMGVCNGNPETTVAAHSNQRIHGKSKGRKAEDFYSVWSCFACHTWLDAGRAAADEKALAFQLAHLDQVNWWRRIATDPREPERFRKAAQWALNELGATPVGAME